MDWTALAFYAVVCGALSVASPRFGAFPWRLGIGAGAGIAAASLLPYLRGMMAY